MNRTNLSRIVALSVAYFASPAQTATANTSPAPITFPLTSVAYFPYNGEENSNGESSPTRSEMIKAEIKMKTAFDLDCRIDERASQITSTNQEYIALGANTKSFSQTLTRDSQNKLIKVTAQGECEVKFGRTAATSDRNQSAPSPVYFQTKVASFDSYEGQPAANGVFVPTGRERDNVQSKAYKIIAQSCTSDTRAKKIEQELSNFILDEVKPDNVFITTEFDPATKTVTAIAHANCRVTFMVRQDGY